MFRDYIEDATQLSISRHYSSAHVNGRNKLLSARVQFSPVGKCTRERVIRSRTSSAIRPVVHCSSFKEIGLAFVEDQRWRLNVSLKSHVRVQAINNHRLRDLSFRSE